MFENFIMGFAGVWLMVGFATAGVGIAWLTLTEKPMWWLCFPVGIGGIFLGMGLSFIPGIPPGTGETAAALFFGVILVGPLRLLVSDDRIVNKARAAKVLFGTAIALTAPILLSQTSLSQMTWVKVLLSPLVLYILLSPALGLMLLAAAYLPKKKSFYLLLAGLLLLSACGIQDIRGHFY